MFCYFNGLAPDSDRLAPNAGLGARAWPRLLPRLRGYRCQAGRQCEPWMRPAVRVLRNGKAVMLMLFTI